MPRTTRAALRLSATIGTSVLLLVLTALPALAASGTKPDPETNPYVVGSMQQLATAAIVGIVVGLIAYTMLPAATDTDDDGHH